MDLHQQYLTKNNCCKFGKTIKPVGIMVHSTGANTPTLRRYVQPDAGIPGSNLYGTHWNQPTPGGQSVCVRLHRYSRYLETSPPIRCRCGRIGGGTAAEAARAVCAASGALEPAKRARTNVPPIWISPTIWVGCWSYWTAPRLSRPGNLARTHTAPARKIPANTFLFVFLSKY